jgi:predicted dienelactone hydrolase
MQTSRRELLLLVAVALTGCGGSSSRHTTDFAHVGPIGVGLRTFTFVDDSRPTPPNGRYAGDPTGRTLVVDVWYPAAVGPGGPGRDAPLASGGPFPLVLHSHGFQDNRQGESYLAEHLAGHGYVVASPDFPLSVGGAPGGATIDDVPEQPGDVRFVLDQLLAESADPKGPLGRAIDPARIAASGLSLGGLTALLVTYHARLHDPRIRGALAMAPPSCFLTPAFFDAVQAPLLLLAGDSDLIVPPAANAERAFIYSHHPSELILFSRGSHTGFTGLASLFNQNKNLDRIGCTAVVGAVDVANFSPLGSEAEGIAADPSVCPMPCLDPPVDPSMPADRQHDLVDTIALSFFDGLLKKDTDAQRFLMGEIAKENTDIQLQLR